MKALIQHSPKSQLMFLSPLIFSTVLSCAGSTGNQGTTPIISVAGAQCTGSGDALKIVIANSTQLNARISEYTTTQAYAPTQIPGVFCFSGEQFWYNISPIIVPSMKLTVASLSCGSATASDSQSTFGCNIESGQPIECYINPTTANSGADSGLINIRTLTCVDELTNLTTNPDLLLCIQSGGHAQHRGC